MRKLHCEVSKKVSAEHIDTLKNAVILAHVRCEQYLLTLQVAGVSTTLPAELPGPCGFSPGVVHSFPSLQLLLLSLLLRAAHA